MGFRELKREDLPERYKLWNLTLKMQWKLLVIHFQNIFHKIWCSILIAAPMMKILTSHRRHASFKVHEVHLSLTTIQKFHLKLSFLIPLIMNRLSIIKYLIIIRIYLVFYKNFPPWFAFFHFSSDIPQLFLH